MLHKDAIHMFEKGLYNRRAKRFWFQKENAGTERCGIKFYVNYQNNKLALNFCFTFCIVRFRYLIVCLFIYVYMFLPFANYLFITIFISFLFSSIIILVFLFSYFC